MLDLMEKIEKACLDKYPTISWFDWQTTDEDIADDAVLTVYRVYEGSRGGSDMVEYAYLTTYGEVLFFEQKLEINQMPTFKVCFADGNCPETEIQSLDAKDAALRYVRIPHEEDYSEEDGTWLINVYSPDGGFDQVTVVNRVGGFYVEGD